MAVSGLSTIDDMEKPISLLKTPLALKTLRNLIRSPPTSMAYAYAVDLPSSESAASSLADVNVIALVSGTAFNIKVACDSLIFR